MRPSSPARTPPAQPASPEEQGRRAQPLPGKPGDSPPRRALGERTQGRVLLGQPGVIIVVFPPLPVLPGVHRKVQRQQLVL